MNPITFTAEEANFLVRMIDLGLKSPQGGAALATRAAIVLNKIGQAAPKQEEPAQDTEEAPEEEEDQGKSS